MKFLLTKARKLFSDIKNAINTAPPRIQLFFIVNLLKLTSYVVDWLASLLNFQPLSTVSSIILILWLGAMLIIALPQTDALLTAIQHWLKPVWRISITILAIVISIETLAIGAIYISGITAHTSQPSTAHTIIDAFTYSDATALTIQAADNLLDGKNPYAYANIITALESSPEAYEKLTPLRTGSFANSFPYPTEEKLKTVWLSTITNPNVIPSEIESKFSYPAGAFLLLVPLKALGINDLRVTLIILLIPTLLYTVMKTPSHKRWYLIFGILLSVELWNTFFASDTRLLYLPFILTSWLLAQKHSWLSAILMGIAIATKQNAWFFLPFYFILIWQTTGRHIALRSIAITLSVFIITNAPFIVADPKLWLSSIMAPMTDKLFPMGNGLISLVTSGLVPLNSSTLFSLLEMLAFVGGIIWYVRYARHYPHTGPLLAVIPIFFAWRSLWGYFYFVDIILLAAILNQEQCHAPKPLI